MKAIIVLLFFAALVFWFFKKVFENINDDEDLLK